MHISTILCNFAVESLADNPSSYDRKIAIPYRAGTIPASVVQVHGHGPRVGSAVKPNRLVVFNFKLPISAYASGCVRKVEIKERLDNHNQTSSQEQYAAYCRFPRERFSEENHSKEDCEHQAAFIDRNDLSHLAQLDSIEIADPRSTSG